MGLFDLVFKLGIDNRDATQKLQDFRSRVNGTSRAVEADFLKTSTGIGTAFGGALAVAAGAFAKTVIDETGRITDLAERLSLPPSVVQGWQSAGEVVGTSVDEIISANKRLTVSQVDAINGSEELRTKFATLGQSLEDLQGVQPDELFRRIAENIKNGGMNAERLDALLGTMGKSADALVPLFNAGLPSSTGSATDEILNSVDAVGDAFTTTLRKGKEFAQFWIGFAGIVAQGVGDVFGLSSPDSKREAALPLPPEILAARQKERDEAKKTAEQDKKDKEKFDKDLAAAQSKEAETRERAVMQRLSPQERRDRLQSQIDALAAQAGDFTNGNALTRSQARSQLTELELQRAGIKDVQGRGGSGRDTERIQSDSLLSAGNFLGSSPDRRAEMELRRSNDYLMRIEQLMQRQAQGGTVRFD